MTRNEFYAERREYRINRSIILGGSFRHNPKHRVAINDNAVGMLIAIKGNHPRDVVESVDGAIKYRRQRKPDEFGKALVKYVIRDNMKECHTPVNTLKSGREWRRSQS